MKINEIEPEYETVNIEKVGIINSQTGGIMLKDNKYEIFMSGFSAEVARIIADFIDGKRQEPPTIYRLVEQICEENEIVLVKVKIYQGGGIFRANLYFTGRKDMIFRNFRASDAIALAVYYNIPILVRKELLQKFSQQ